MIWFDQFAFLYTYIRYRFRKIILERKVINNISVKAYFEEQLICTTKLWIYRSTSGLYLIAFFFKSLTIIHPLARFDNSYSRNTRVPTLNFKNTSKLYWFWRSEDEIHLLVCCDKYEEGKEHLLEYISESCTNTCTDLWRQGYYR